MTIKKDHDEIWYWYQKIQEFHESGMEPKEYCDSYEVDYKKFTNMKYRIDFKKFTDTALYEESLPIARKYLASGDSAYKFAKANSIDINLLGQMSTHLRYIDIIERMKQAIESKEEKKMSFIQVPPNSSVTFPIITEQEHEVVEKQNDIEIIINKGVKVIISPNIESMKIIKIIEFLKDL